MTVHIGHEDCIVTTTIDRERKLNALDYPTIDALLAAPDRIDSDDSIRAVVLPGAGRRAFSAGADIPSLAGSIEGGAERPSGRSSGAATRSPGGSRSSPSR